MTITIGEQTLATTRPGDLDALLIAATGCGVAEHAAMLAHEAAPYQIARALRPMLSDDDAPSLPALTEMITDADVTAVRVATVALLSQPDAAPPVPIAPVIAPVVG